MTNAWPAPNPIDIAAKHAQLKLMLDSEIAAATGTPSERVTALVDNVRDIADERRPNTQRAYQKDQLRYRGVFERHGDDPLAPTTDQWNKYFTDYATELIPWSKNESGPRRHDTVKRHAAAIAFLFRQHGLVPPTLTWEHKDLMRGLSRHDTRSTRHAKPLNRTRVDALLADKPQTLRGLRDKALETLESSRGFRSATSVNMRLEHLHVDKKGALIGMRDEKTATSHDLVTIGVRHTRYHRQCAPCALRELKEELGCSEGPVFRAIDRWGNISARAMSPRSVTYLLRKNLAHAGVSDADEYSSHSYRHWVVKHALAQGWTIQEIMQTTLHRSERGVRPYLAGIDPWYLSPKRSILEQTIDEPPNAGRGWRHMSATGD